MTVRNICDLLSIKPNKQLRFWAKRILDISKMCKQFPDLEIAITGRKKATMFVDEAKKRFKENPVLFKERKVALNDLNNLCAMYELSPYWLKVTFKHSFGAYNVWIPDNREILALLVGYKC